MASRLFAENRKLNLSVNAAILELKELILSSSRTTTKQVKHLIDKETTGEFYLFSQHMSIEIGWVFSCWNPFISCVVVGVND